MKLSQPFVRLPFSFDVIQLRKELGQFEEHCWMAHPNRMTGNSAIPLVSVNGEDNDDFSGEMQVTPHLQRCEYIQQIMANFDEVIARSRLMRLGPGSEVSLHVDFNYHWYSRVRIHIPITTNPEVAFHCGDEAINMGAGECWIFDSWRAHKVVNDSAHERVHLVIDTAGSAKFWRMVDAMSEIEEQDFKATEVAYRPGHSSSIRTERFNVAPVMSPGELEALTQELIADFTANPENDLDTVTYYRSILRDLAKDWRSIWLEYGIQPAGYAKYQLLLNQTVKKMAPHPRTLVAKSNNVGVNPIMMQRILRSALFTEERQRFIEER